MTRYLFLSRKSSSQRTTLFTFAGCESSISVFFNHPRFLKEQLTKQFAVTYTKMGTHCESTVLYNDETMARIFYSGALTVIPQRSKVEYRPQTANMTRAQAGSVAFGN